MKSNYRQIGEFIQLVDERNKDLRITTLLGLSINKVFIPSVANTIGSDMANYKIIRKGQFACSIMQVRRDKKIPVALLQDFDEAIISQAYPVFEVMDRNELDPEYLMMWMSRSEFDRHACFLAVGGVRGSMEWEDFLEMPIPVPSIEKQQEIVKEYNTVVNRIKLNEQLNQKLEETAQALYKHWFVDFEFPITKESHRELVSGFPQLEGKPYKSSGGKMVYNEELGKEIPDGWDLMNLSEICEITFSKRIYQSEYTSEGVPFYRSKEIILKRKGLPIHNARYISLNRRNEIVKKFGGINEGDILLTAVGTIGISYMVSEKDDFYFKDGNLFWFRLFKKRGYNSLIFEWMQNELFANSLEEITFGSTQRVITTAAVYLMKHLIPKDQTLFEFDNRINGLRQYIVNLKEQIRTLYELKNLILSKMTVEEEEREVEV